MPKCILEAGRRASNADRVFVCRTDENLGEFRVGLATKSARLRSWVNGSAQDRPILR